MPPEKDTTGQEVAALRDYEWVKHEQRKNAVLYKEYREVTRRSVQMQLAELANEDLSDLETKRENIENIRVQLHQAQLCVLCPGLDGGGCGKHAMIECVTPGNSKKGIIRYRHLEKGDQSGHTTASKIHPTAVVDKPPAEPRKSHFPNASRKN